MSHNIDIHLTNCDYASLNMEYKRFFQGVQSHLLQKGLTNDSGITVTANRIANSNLYDVTYSINMNGDYNESFLANLVGFMMAHINGKLGDNMCGYKSTTVDCNMGACIRP